MSQTAKAPIRSSFPTVIAVLGAFFLFYVLYVFLNDSVKAEPIAEAPAETAIPSLAESKGKGSKLLSEYQVTNAAEGKVRLPISRAKELIIAENAK